MSRRKHDFIQEQKKLKYFPGSIKKMYFFKTVINLCVIKMKPYYLTWHIGNNDGHNRTRAEILVKLLRLDSFVNEQHENCATFLSVAISRRDSAKSTQLIKNLGNIIIS